MQDLIGKHIGNFIITESLGKGGQGQVFLAQHRENEGLKVAIKMLLPGAQPDDIDLLFREAKEMASLNHPHIVRITDFSTDKDPFHPYMVMEYIVGGSLATLLEDATELNPEQIANIALRLCDALNEAHKKGIVHRDIKPQNILMDGLNPKLADWGIAKVPGLGTIVGTGNFRGTYIYASPEQVTGKSDLDGRSDIYSLGIVLYELLSGAPPWNDVEHENVIIQRHMNGEPVPELPSSDDVPGEMRRIVNRCIQQDEADRYQSPLDMAADLENFLSDEPVEELQNDEPLQQVENPTPDSNARASDSVVQKAVLAITKSNRLRRIQILITAISITLGVVFLLLRFTNVWQEIETLRGGESADIGVVQTTGSNAGTMVVGEWTSGVGTPEPGEKTPGLIAPPPIAEIIATPEPKSSANTAFYSDPLEVQVLPGDSASLSSGDNKIVIQIPNESYKDSYKLVLRSIQPHQSSPLPGGYAGALAVFNLSIVNDQILDQEKFLFDKSVRVNVGFNEIDASANASIPVILRRISNQWQELETYQYSGSPIIFAEINHVGLFAVTLRE